MRSTPATVSGALIATNVLPLEYSAVVAPVVAGTAFGVDQIVSAAATTVTPVSPLPCHPLPPPISRPSRPKYASPPSPRPTVGRLALLMWARVASGPQV